MTLAEKQRRFVILKGGDNNPKTTQISGHLWKKSVKSKDFFCVYEVSKMVAYNCLVN